MTATDPSFQNDVDIQSPQKPSFFKSLKDGGHLKCLLLTLLIFGCVAVIVWCRVAQISRLVVNFHHFPVSSRQKTSPCDEGYVYIPVAFMIMLYLVYLVECWHSSTRLELTYKVDGNDIQQYIERMKESKAIIWWKAISYHYVRRTRQVTRYRNGDAYTTSQQYLERVNSRVAASCYVYTHCGSRDVSNKLIDLEKNPRTKIRFSKDYCFASIDAAIDYYGQRDRFYRENAPFDEHMEIREGVDLLGVDFHPLMITVANKDKLPWYISLGIFWLFSLFLLSWPLRIIIDSQTAFVEYKIKKAFGTCSPSSLREEQLHRIRTVDSVEMERLIANRLNLAPSYSEAVLLDNSYAYSSLESGLHLDNQTPSNHRHQRRHSSSRAEDTEFILPEQRRIPKSISLPFKPFQEMRRLSMSRRLIPPRSSRETPPCYDEAVMYSYPLVRYVNLRRSATDRDLSVLRPLRSSWNNLFHWMKRTNETEL
ncbi:transmembrane protein 151B-like isoform X2 [Argiope bruennichi]|uniref:transmembrane protein 151B-like isoform X2 n=1 Tax=Argiope bruennichi TaxID=94029 RepID=UPI0024951F3A|nr:transmembrane protein 151B-like isoform X2 [Argiope bruennichi]